MTNDIISEYHFQVLLNYYHKHAFSREAKDQDFLNELGRDMITWHYKSVGADIEADDLDDPKYFTFKAMDVSLSPVEIIKACHGLEYMSNNDENYYQSLAYNYTERVTDLAIRQLPGYFETPFWLEEPGTPRVPPLADEFCVEDDLMHRHAF